MFLVLRLGNLLTAVESVSWTEELYEGTLAKELIEGLKTSLWNYQATDFGPGSLFVGILAVPLFLLFGPSLFALKLVPLHFFSLPTLVILFFFLKRQFSEKAGFWGSLLFIFSPPSFTANSLVAIGSHTASILFSITMLFLFYEFLYGTKHRLLFLLLFGAVSGFAFYFIFTTFLTLLACLISWFFLDRATFLSRKFFIFLGALVLGLSPFIAYEMSHQLGGTHFLIGAFSPALRWMETFPKLPFSGLKKLFHLLTVTVPLSFCPRFGMEGRFLGYTYYGVFLGILFFFLRHEGGKDKKILPLLFYPLFFMMIYTASVFRTFLYLGFFAARYLVPLHFFILLLTAIALGVQRLRFFKIALIILGLISQGSLLFREDFGRALHYKGYSYHRLGFGWGFSNTLSGGKSKDIWKILSHYPEGIHRQIYRGFVERNFAHHPEEIKPESIFQSLKTLPPPYRYYYLESLGNFNEPHASQWLGVVLKGLAEEERKYIYHGLAAASKRIRNFSLTDPSSQREANRWWLSVYEKENSQDIRLKRKKRVHRERGELFGYLWRLSGCGFEEALTLVPLHVLRSRSAYPEDFYWGAGWGVRTIADDDRIRAMDWIKRLPPEGRGPARQGSLAYDKWYWLSD